MNDSASSLPVPIDNGHGRVSTLDQLAETPEEEIWLQKQKSARTHRAYRLDAQHFMRTLEITAPEELRQADHKAVIAWSATCVRSSVRPRRRSAGASRRCPRSISTS
jgi:site-specific recombinase XerD